MSELRFQTVVTTSHGKELARVLAPDMERKVITVRIYEPGWAVEVEDYTKPSKVDLTHREEGNGGQR